MRKVYFGKETEIAIRQYLKTDVHAERERIYLQQIKPAFEKLVENIINMPKFNFKRLGSFRQLQDEVINHLYASIPRFNPNRRSKKTGKRTKAFSYFGTIAKNYLAGESIKRSKTDYLIEDSSGQEIDLQSLQVLSEESLENDIETAEFFKILIAYFEDKRETLTDDEKKINDAITYFLRNVKVETIYNKKHFYLLLRELTGLSSKQITSILSKFKKEYQAVRQEYYEELM